MKKQYDRATMYTKGMLGNVVRTEVRELTVETAEDSGALVVRYTPKGKRKARRMVLNTNPVLMVVRGWGGPSVRGFFNRANVDQVTGVSVSEGRYAGFDPRFVSDARAELKAAGADVDFDASKGDD